MNQILMRKTDVKVSKFKNNKKNIYYFLLFLLTMLAILFLLFYLFYYVINHYKKVDIAHSLAKSFSISSLYNNNEKYTTEFLSTNKDSKSPFVIGVIEIDSINLHYPILSYATEESLKISPCRFAGPMPNNIGNLCIAAHNYKDSSFFGKLSRLSDRRYYKII